MPAQQQDRHYRPSQQPQTATTPSSSLLQLDEASTKPFSSYFDNNNNFDLATVEATVPLADRSIFVASDGRRYYFQSIPDGINYTNPGASLSQGHLPPTPTHTPASVSISPPNSLPASFNHPSSRLHDLRTPNSSSASIRRRPPSNASSHSYSSAWTGRSGPLPGVIDSRSSGTGTESTVHTDEVTSMMSNLRVNRFSATPLFGESDGGVQAAEALTEPNTGVVLPPMSPPTSMARPVSPRTVPDAQQEHQYADGVPAQQRAIYGSQVASIDYSGFTMRANYQAQQDRQQATASTGPTLPSLMEYSSPVAGSFVVGTGVAPEPFAPASGLYSPLDSPEKELYEGGAGGYYTPAGEYYPYHYQYQHQSPPPPPPAPIQSPAFTTSTTATALGRSTSTTSYLGQQPNYVNIGSSANRIDTQTPVVVVAPQRHPSSTSTADSRSTGRDNVLPGEDVLFDGPVLSAPTLTSPVFQDGQLKVFRNTITNDLRFHCKVGGDSETYWIKGSNAQLVPVYAYDQRFPKVVYIRDKESDKATSGTYYNMMQPQQGHGRPNGIYKFDRSQELFDFQAKLTGEKVVLDIGSVKLVKLSKARNGSSDTFYSVRLQIWHEGAERRGGTLSGGQSDVASFVTAGTALSGPMRDRMVASSSRLMVYLGRLGEYVQVIITDDIEVKTDGPTKVKLKPRKAGAFSRENSRFKGIKAHIEPKGDTEMAGLDINGQSLNPDVEYTFDLYKTFELEFENSPSQDNFIRKWDEVIKERRVQRARLKQIQEEMESAGILVGATARQILL